MKATEKGTFKPVKLPEEGTHVARCYSVIHIGTVPNIFNGKLNPEKPLKEVIYITWELPKLKAVFNDEKGPEPFVVGEELNLSTNENSNLSKLIAQWRGKKLSAEEQKSFDPSIMVGKTCLINVIHQRKKKFVNEKIEEITNANTMLINNGIMAKPKEMECPEHINPYYIWDWDKHATPFSKEIFDKMPKWLKERVKESEEYKKYGPIDSGNSEPEPSSTPTGKVGGNDSDGWG